jgi:hypothetical protein
VNKIKLVLLAIAITVIAVSAVTLLLILGAITPNNIIFAKKHPKGSDNTNHNNNNNDQKQKDDSNNGSNPPTDQPTNSGDQSATDQPGNTVDQPLSSDENPPPPPVQQLLPVNPPTSKVDCSKTPDDPSCPPPKLVAPVDCVTNPTDPSCPPLVAKAAVTSPPGPDDSCLFHPEQEKCKPDQSGNCPSGFLLNGKGHCFPDKKCPKGFEKQNNDETGTCHPITVTPPLDPAQKDCKINRHDPTCTGKTGRDGLPFCDLVKRGSCYDRFDNHPDYCKHFPKDRTCQPCPNGFHYVNGKCVKTIVVHKTLVKHITSNNDQNSMVTRNTKITDQLTVGQAIDGCKALTKKSPDNALKKSCNIMMAATFNYCMTHTKLWLTDSNICSDNLYLKTVQRYIAENVTLKLFPATIYNIRP